MDPTDRCTAQAHALRANADDIRAGRWMHT